MADLAGLKQAVLDEHQKLTASFEEAQRAAETAWSAYEGKRAELQAFRKEYGKVIKALKGDEPKAGGVTAGAVIGQSQVTLKAGGK